MFAGNTEELLRRVRRAVIAGQRVQVFTHRLDLCSGTDRVASHAGLDHPSVVAGSADDIRRAVRPETDMVAVDEAHFFGADLTEVADRVARDGVVVAGLDVTFAGRPFEPLPSLMALAERVDKLTASCTVCGADAIFHARGAHARGGHRGSRRARRRRGEVPGPLPTPLPPMSARQPSALADEGVQAPAGA
jgi:thymidine kinase